MDNNSYLPSDDLNALVQQSSAYGGDTTGEMVEAIFATGRAGGANEIVLGRLQQMKNAFADYLDEPFENVPLDMKWKMVAHLNGIGGTCFIYQGRLLEHLWLEYHGDRKRFFEDCNQRGLKQKAVDDRRRVYRVLGEVLRSRELGWREAVGYITSIQYTLWREITQAKWNGRWEWRDGKVYLTSPAKGAGRELSTFAGNKDEKADNLLRLALMDSSNTPPPDEPDEPESPNGLTPALSTPTDVNTWDLIGDDETPDRQVRGVNITPVGDSSDTDFEKTEASFSAWYEFHQSEQVITGRKVHFYDPHLEQWRVFDLPDVTGEEVIQ